MESATGPYAVGGLVAATLFVLGFASPGGRPGGLLGGAAVVALLIAIRKRYVVRVTPEELRSRTLMRDVRMRWREIVYVARAADRGYWPSRVFAPETLEFGSSRDKLRINFKLFPGECRKDVLSHVPSGLWRIE